MKTEQSQNRVQFVEVDAEYQGQRIDNFLRTRQKGVPKSLIYRVIRKGEVRVNKKRVKPEYKLQPGDLVRIPPMRVAERDAPELPSASLNKVSQLESCIIYEDAYLIVINKPSGIAVHGGSGVTFGLIEGLRSLRPEQKFLELVHRLDKDTSGCILVAKRRSTLKALQDQLRAKTMNKDYLALVRGQWQAHDKKITAPLLKITLKSGERIVRVNSEGKPSKTLFSIEQRYADATLVKASPVTGRTHQIRVHCQYTGHPIACDDKYGEQGFDRKMGEQGLKRLFLHAARLSFYHPNLEVTQTVEAPLPDHLKACLAKLTKI
ncbi:23S rRNA pseudouridine(955/2504/2580) synthase RluC [Paraferrimonas sedimenticola]|uniref:Pseudouridine synthase n=1 Tax=Paraferrimonas sedimenticola TaxID=375674 RepID=A0AA37RYS3_9GAMM|nr:23S rRNA pseudouridine(955/2504/2580) synthase RluC [Paraferrimonas sedimenticola]GLP97896.1 pseudouridine synthase [Paraferrimonas sedimenticola]